MRTQTTENQTVATIANNSEAFTYTSPVSYHEMADVPVRETDTLEQLQANMNTLADLQLRMNFVMREVRYLMKV